MQPVHLTTATSETSLENILIDVVNTGSVQSVTETLSEIKSLTTKRGKKPADVINKLGSNGKTALTAACELKNSPQKTEIISNLLDAGAEPRVKDAEGNTAAIYLAKVGDIESLEKLVKSQGGLNIFLDQDRDGLTPLMRAIEFDCNKIQNTAPVILGFYGQESKQDLSLQQSSPSLSPRNPALVKMLDLRDKNQQTALKHSMRKQLPHLTKLFLEAGASVNNQDWSDFQAPLVGAAMVEEKTSMLETLLTYGADVDQVGFKQTTALMAAIKTARINNIVALLAAMPDLTKTDENSNNALHWLLLSKTAYLYGEALEAAKKLFTQLAQLSPRITDKIFGEKNHQGKTPLSLLAEILENEEEGDEEFFINLIKPFCQAQHKNKNLLQQFMTLAVNKLYQNAADRLFNAGCNLPEEKAIPKSRATDQENHTKFKIWREEASKKVQGPEHKSVKFIPVKDLMAADPMIKILKTEITKKGDKLQSARRQTTLNASNASPNKSMRQRADSAFTTIKLTMRFKDPMLLEPLLGTRSTNQANEELSKLLAATYQSDAEKAHKLAHFITTTNHKLTDIDIPLLFKAVAFVLNYESNSSDEKEVKNSVDVIKKLKKSAAAVFNHADNTGCLLHHVVQGRNRETSLQIVQALDVAPYRMTTSKDKAGKTTLDVCRYAEVFEVLQKRSAQADLLDIAFYFIRNPEFDTVRAERSYIFQHLIFLLKSEKTNNTECITQLLWAGILSQTKTANKSVVFNNILERLIMSLPEGDVRGLGDDSRKDRLLAEKARLQPAFEQLNEFFATYPSFARVLGLEPTPAPAAEQKASLPPVAAVSPSPTSAGTAALVQAGSPPTSAANAPAPAQADAAIIAGENKADGSAHPKEMNVHATVVANPPIKLTN